VNFLHPNTGSLVAMFLAGTYCQILIVMCVLHSAASAEAEPRSSNNFLGMKDTLGESKDPEISANEHTGRLNNHLWSMKGLVPITDSGSLSLADEGLFDHPSLFNISLLMILLFIAILSIISGTAGLIILVNTSKLGKVELFTTGPGAAPDLAEFCGTPVSLKHPGCVRIHGRDSQDKLSQFHSSGSTVAVRE